MLEDLKTRFKQDMTFLWPDGTNNRHQVRDLFRVYAMGCVGGLMAAEENQRVVALMGELQAANTHDVNWWPDDSFNWW